MLTWLRKVLAGVTEPFTSRRHAHYIAQIHQLRADIQRLRDQTAVHQPNWSGPMARLERERLGFERDVAAIRKAMAGFEAARLAEDMAALRARLDGVEQALGDVRETIKREQGNLGMVASGLTALRGDLEDFDLARIRFQAYELSLKDIARRLDRLAEAGAAPEASQDAGSAS